MLVNILSLKTRSMKAYAKLMVKCHSDNRTMRDTQTIDKIFVFERHVERSEADAILSP